MSFQKEIRALQSQIDLNTKDSYLCQRTLAHLLKWDKDKCKFEYPKKSINKLRRRIKQLAENQRVLKSIIGEYIRIDRVFKE